MMLINLLGISLIFAIMWWFWWYPKARVAAPQNSNTVLVSDGVYSPSVLKVPANKAVSLVFNRKDASPCAEKVVFTSLNKTFELVTNKPTEIDLGKLTPGRYPFSCQMQMYRGELIVEKI
jgi:plastocyanin domain-containing protein